MQEYSSPFDDECCKERYLYLRKSYPHLFDPTDNDDGAIEIVSSEAEFEDIRLDVIDRRRKSQKEIGDTRIGLLAHDPYMMVIRDPVRFPDGTRGLYNRIICGHCSIGLPLLGNQVVLIKVFRHGIRDWSIEFPRGGCDPGEMPAETVIREIKEEIGADAVSLHYLGKCSPGGSNLAVIGHLFLANIETVGKLDIGEGIKEMVTLEVREVEEMIQNGKIIDGFTMAAFLRARLRGLI